MPGRPSARRRQGSRGTSSSHTSHLDNEAQISREGWVSSFHPRWRCGWASCSAKPVIWRNPKSHGEDTLDEAQIQRIPKSALLITVLSPRYVKSEWCHRELQEFVKASATTGGPKWGSHYRVFKVVKTPTPTERHPPEIKPLLAYEFFKIDQDTGRPRSSTRSSARRRSDHLGPPR
jgi:hypothetical protein